MPTALELAGVAKPGHVQFHSLLPMIRRTNGSSPYSAIYGAYLQLQRAVTFDGYKLILYPKIKKARLYHLAKDPGEMHDLAGEDGEQPRMKQLFKQLLRLQTETGDTLDLKQVYPELS